MSVTAFYFTCFNLGLDLQKEIDKQRDDSELTPKEKENFVGRLRRVSFCDFGIRRKLRGHRILV